MIAEINKGKELEPVWPSLLALLATGGLHMALPEALAVGPRWSLLALVMVTMVPAHFVHARGHHQFCKPIGFFIIGTVTVELIISVALLVLAIPRHVETPEQLLHSAAALWVTNIITFAVWYWRLDAGGPHKRNMRDAHSDGAFLFPQMTMEVPCESDNEQENWAPLFIDYLFLAFNTSTALSPTDVPVLSRWAKVLMMIQSAISLAVVALLAARAVNVL